MSSWAVQVLPVVIFGWKMIVSPARDRGFKMCHMSNPTCMSSWAFPVLSVVILGWKMIVSPARDRGFKMCHTSNPTCTSSWAFPVLSVVIFGWKMIVSPARDRGFKMCHMSNPNLHEFLSLCCTSWSYFWVQIFTMTFSSRILMDCCRTMIWLMKHKWPKMAQMCF